MAYAMTKQGSLDNCITYEFMCDTVADMNAIENRYRTIGTVAIVLSGESGMEVYIAGSDKQWNSLSSISGGTAGDIAGLVIHICAQDEVSNGLPDIDEPDETTIYLVAAGNTTGNLYEEYIYVDDAWEKFGAASIDLSNYIQKTDIATQSTAGLVKVLDNGNVTFNENNQLVLTLAGTAVVKTGQSDHPISVTHQHEAAFYGLAKAAGQDMKNSDNAVGTYTTEAASAIRTMIGAGTYSKPAGGIPAADLASGVIPDVSGLAPKDSPAFTGSISLGRKVNTTAGSNSSAVGSNVEASGSFSHAEGVGSIASNNSAHAEGAGTTASGVQSHVEGAGSIASGNQSHAEGASSKAIGDQSHAEGGGNKATGTYAHAEGVGTIAIGQAAHVEGQSNSAMGTASHAEGQSSRAMGAQSHAEGLDTRAIGLVEHVSGQYNFIDSTPAWVASNSYNVNDLVSIDQTLNADGNAYTRTVIYKCKTANSDASFNSTKWTEWGQYLVAVGNGTANNARSNAYALDWDGNGHFAGDIYVGCNADSTSGTKLPRIPEAPSIDGSYILQTTVTNGTPTYTWVSLNSLSGVTF